MVIDPIYLFQNDIAYISLCALKLKENFSLSIPYGPFSNMKAEFAIKYKFRISQNHFIRHFDPFLQKQSHNTPPKIPIDCSVG